MRNIYLILCNGSTLVVEGTVMDAIRSAAERCRGKRVEIYRARIVAALDPDELDAVRQSIGVKGEAPKAVVVLDQMFRGFGEIIDRELADVSVEVYEIYGKEAGKPMKIGDRVYAQPARDDYDILKFLEGLSNMYERVIFFTGDKKLAAQAKLIPSIYVEYLPPSAIVGKEHAATIMVKRIREILSNK